MAFTAADLASMRACAESLMTDEMFLEDVSGTPDGYGGNTVSRDWGDDPVPCRLVTQRTGRETTEEQRIFARCDWLLRFPHDVTLREDQRVQVNGQAMLVIAVSDVRTEPHVQNIAGVRVRR